MSVRTCFQAAACPYLCVLAWRREWTVEEELGSHLWGSTVKIALFLPPPHPDTITMGLTLQHTDLGTHRHSVHNMDVLET